MADIIPAQRKKSPRAPAIPLEEALERAMRIYDRERLHPAPTEVIAQHMGYKSANNGTALAALANLRYFGLLERPKEGMLAVTKNVESYKFAPHEEIRRSLLLTFLRSPELYRDLLEKYATALPSEPNLKYELIQRGFLPASADAVLSAFFKSVEYTGFYAASAAEEAISVQPIPTQAGAVLGRADVAAAGRHDEEQGRSVTSLTIESPSADSDRIPVRLSGGRRAWLIVPAPLYEADKARLKAQIDLLLTDD